MGHWSRLPVVWSAEEDGMGVLGSTAVSMASQATRLGKGSSVMAQDERMP